MSRQGKRKTHLQASSDGGFQTLLVSMILSAGQQKGHLAGCHSVGVAAAGWLESGSECCGQQAESKEKPDDGKWGPLALPMFRQHMTELR